MTDKNLQSHIEEAETNWQSAAQGNPGNNTWGFFSYGDASAAIGGGVGMFIWFPNRHEMLDFIATTFPYSPPGRSDLDWDAVASKTAAIIEGMKQGKVEDLDGVKQLNEVLKSFSQTEWMGTFSELLTGKHSYATKVRAAFRDDDDDDDDENETSGTPIRFEEEEAFRDFLQTWGC